MFKILARLPPAGRGRHQPPPGARARPGLMAPRSALLRGDIETFLRAGREAILVSHDEVIILIIWVDPDFAGIVVVFDRIIDK